MPFTGAVVWVCAENGVITGAVLLLLGRASTEPKAFSGFCAATVARDRMGKWEGTQPGQLVPHGQKDIPDQDPMLSVRRRGGRFVVMAFAFPSNLGLSSPVNQNMNIRYFLFLVFHELYSPVSFKPDAEELWARAGNT